MWWKDGSWSMYRSVLVLRTIIIFFRFLAYFIALFHLRMQVFPHLAILSILATTVGWSLCQLWFLQIHWNPAEISRAWVRPHHQLWDLILRPKLTFIMSWTNILQICSIGVQISSSHMALREFSENPCRTHFTTLLASNWHDEVDSIDNLDRTLFHSNTLTYGHHWKEVFLLVVQNGDVKCIENIDFIRAGIFKQENKIESTML